MFEAIRPLRDRIVVRRLEEADTGMIGSIVIPEAAKEKPQKAEVVAVGKGRRAHSGELIPLDVQPGDKILFGKYSGNEIKIEREEYLILREDEILGVLAV